MQLPRALLLVYAVVVGTYTCEGFTGVVLPAYLQHQGIALAQIGGILAAMNLAALGSRIPAGLLYRPERANWSVAAALVVMAASTAAIPLTDSDVVLGGLRLTHGFAFGVATTLNMAQFFDVRPARIESGRAMGFFAAAIALGFVIGGFLGGWWADTFGFGAAFVSAALFPLLAAAINLSIGPDVAQRPTPGRASSGRRSAVRASLEAARNPGILLAALLLFSTNLLNQAFQPYFTLYALDVGHSLTVIGLLIGVAGFLAMFVRVIAGELSRWWSYQTITAVALTLSAVGSFLVPTTTLLVPLGSLMILMSVLRAVLTVTGGASVIDATATTAVQRGVASGLFNMGKDLGAIAGPLCGGLVAAQVGVPATFQVMAVVTLLLFWGGTALLAPHARRARVASGPATPASHNV